MKGKNKMPNATVINVGDTDYNVKDIRIDSVLEDTKNLWTFGDQTFERFVQVEFNTPIPAGTYTISALITSEASGNNCLVSFLDTSLHALEDCYIDKSVTERKGSTVILSEACGGIILFSGRGSSVSTGYSATYTAIQLEAGDAMTYYVPPVSAVDYIARAQDGILIQKTRNLWTFGNKTFIRYESVVFDPPLPAGTYTISALITSEAAGTNNLIEFDNASGQYIADCYINRSSVNRNSATVTLTEPCKTVILFSGRGSSVSTGYTATYKDVQLERGSTMTGYVPPVTAVDYIAREYERESEESNYLPKGFFSYGNMESGDYIYDMLSANSIRSNDRIVFNADITSFSSLEIGFANGSTSNKVNRFVIDSTNLTVYDFAGNTNITAHGLTITNNIQVLIESNFMRQCDITIISNGVLFKATNETLDRRGVCFSYAQSIGSVLTDAKLAWTCIDFDKEIWIFGDSYAASYTDKWTKYMFSYGYYKNCLFDAYPGEDSLKSYESLMHLLSLAKPKVIVWTLGMNDGGDGVSSPSVDWGNVQTQLRSLCNDRGIQLVLATVPTVPTVNNEQKNNNVRSSGYRYIDFAKAVDANASGEWFSGMLSEDGVHPTDAGAKALFGRVVLDLPESMISDR